MEQAPKKQVRGSYRPLYVLPPRMIENSSLLQFFFLAIILQQLFL
ncbi:hypothetical protein SLEP1_g25338 [Rubroshorea leprosula]|uniref:Uncharacterized protein n=1 Tax=Rubroshorea leprosula TaxID=152421 RepID=A0AAV5JPQ8_9ROSI|nr:hypothetical protein SLEP1_g25338 [Rubroshorea leprosula]